MLCDRRSPGEGGNEEDVLKPYHLAMQIIDVEDTFKGELVLNPKVMFLECGEGLGPERSASTQGVVKSHAWMAMGNRAFALIP
jgi:hypothetical protein